VNLNANKADLFTSDNAGRGPPIITTKTVFVCLTINPHILCLISPSKYNR